MLKSAWLYFQEHALEFVAATCSIIGVSGVAATFADLVVMWQSHLPTMSIWSIFCIVIGVGLGNSHNFFDIKEKKIQEKDKARIRFSRFSYTDKLFFKQILEKGYVDVDTYKTPSVVNKDTADSIFLVNEIIDGVYRIRLTESGKRMVYASYDLIKEIVAS